MSLEVKPKISVLLVVFNEEKYIKSALESVYNQTIPTKEIELIIVDGGSTDNTTSICSSFKEEYYTDFFEIKLLANPKKVLASGWNMGILQSQSDYVVRFDGHSTLAPDYIENGLLELECTDPTVVCVGGWMEHHSDTRFGKFASIFYSSIIGGGSAAFRRKPKQLIKSDTALFAIYKKHELINIGLFNESLERNQDIDLHKRFKASGLSFCTSPRMRVSYYVRATITQFLKKAYKDGYWVGASKGYLFRHLIPLFFSIYVFILFTTMLFSLNSIIQLLLLAPMLVYFLIILSDLLKNGKTFTESMLSPFMFFSYHMCYGIGTMWGLIRSLKQ